jgi:Domain of unknown function (DUF4412)
MNKSLLLAVMFVVAALNSFAKEGLYVEFKLNAKSYSGTFKCYGADGNSRAEMSMVSPSLPNPINVVTLKLKDNSNKSYSLNERDKTYSEIDISKSSESDDENYEITVIGNEKVNNYNSVHVKVFYKKSGNHNDMWLSKDVPGYARFVSLKMKYVGSSNPNPKEN